MKDMQESARLASLTAAAHSTSRVRSCTSVSQPMKPSTALNTKLPSSSPIWDNDQTEAMTIKVFEIIGEFAVAAEDGQRLYDRIMSILASQNSIELDFSGVRVVATPFFNAAIGRLLKDVSPENLHARVSFSNLSPVGQQVLAKVVENAKQYYHGDPAARAALDKILVDQTEEH